MENIKIVTMKKEHINSLVCLEKICFSEPWSINSLSFELTNKNSCFMVAIQNEIILGYVGMHFVLNEGYITNIAIFPEFRGKGIAKKLLKSILEYCEKNNFLFLTLEVRMSNIVAINLYKNLGFLQVSIRKNFYKKPIEDAIIMTKTFSSKQNLH